MKKYIAAFLMEMQAEMEYRAEFLLSIVSGGFVVVIQFFLWTAIYEGNGETELYGYNYSQMIVYVIMAGIMSRVVSTYFPYFISRDIKEGNLSRFLVQPIDYMPFRIFGELGRKSVQYILAIFVSGGVLAILSAKIGVQFNLWGIIVALFITPLSILLNFMMFYCFSMLGFWMTEAWAVFNGLDVVSMVLSGGVFPLNVFGKRAQVLFQFLPFQYITYFPLNIICGTTWGIDVIYGLVAQIIWIIIWYVLARFLWKKGMKKYIAAGG